MARIICVVAVLIGLVVFGAGCSLQRSPIINSVDMSKIDYSNASSLKESQACATYIFGVIGPIGDPSVMRAIQNGGLKNVKAVDYKSGFYLLFTKDCVVVYGD